MKKTHTIDTESGAPLAMEPSGDVESRSEDQDESASEYFVLNGAEVPQDEGANEGEDGGEP